MRLSHRRPFGDPKSGEEIALANLENYDEVDAVMQGVDAVIHLGGKAEEGTWDVVLKSNILYLGIVPLRKQLKVVAFLTGFL